MRLIKQLRRSLLLENGTISRQSLRLVSFVEIGIMLVWPRHNTHLFKVFRSRPQLIWSVRELSSVTWKSDAWLLRDLSLLVLAILAEILLGKDCGSPNRCNHVRYDKSWLKSWRERVLPSSKHSNATASFGVCYAYKAPPLEKYRTGTRELPPGPQNWWVTRASGLIFKQQCEGTPIDVLTYFKVAITFS